MTETLGHQHRQRIPKGLRRNARLPEEKRHVGESENVKKGKSEKVKRSPQGSSQKSKGKRQKAKKDSGKVKK